LRSKSQRKREKKLSVEVEFERLCCYSLHLSTFDLQVNFVDIVFVLIYYLVVVQSLWFVTM